MTLLVSQSAQGTFYNDSLVLPVLGTTNVQGAIDVIKTTAPGGLQLTTNVADIQPIGIQALGVSNKASPADHVHSTTMPANVSLGAQAGTGGLALGSATGDSVLPTGNLSWTGASTKTVSLISTGAASSITFTAGAASTWGTSSGALTVNGSAGINLQFSGTTFIDVGVTSSTAITTSGTATLSAQGGIKFKITTTAISYTVLTTDIIVAVTDNSSARTITLPAAASAATGRVYFIKDQAGTAGSANNITIDADGAELIDGVASITISANYGAARLYTNGSAWFTI